MAMQGMSITTEVGNRIRGPYDSMRMLSPVVATDPTRLTTTKVKLKQRLRFSLLLWSTIMLFRSGMKAAWRKR